MNIQWYPGHMTKTRRMIAEQLKNVDAVCEILDARIPISSRNPDVDELTAGKPRLVVLNRVDQADPASTRRWADFFRARGYAVLETNAKAAPVQQDLLPLCGSFLRTSSVPTRKREWQVEWSG